MSDESALEGMPSLRDGRGHSMRTEESAVGSSDSMGQQCKARTVSARRCSVPGCENTKFMRRGMCGMHYVRLQRSGLPEDWQPYRPLTVVSSSAHPLVKKLLKIASQHRIQIQDLEAAAGLGVGTMAQWYRSHKGHQPKVYYPRLAMLEAVLNVLGYRLAILPIDGRGVGRPAREVIE